MLLLLKHFLSVFI